MCGQLTFSVFVVVVVCLFQRCFALSLSFNFLMTFWIYSHALALSNVIYFFNCFLCIGIPFPRSVKYSQLF